MSSITLYHVTPITNLENILKIGLIPQIGMLSDGVEIKKKSLFISHI